MTTIKDAAKQLRGRAKRAFEARVAIDYLHGSARRVETVFGWDREAVFKGVEEFEGSPVPGKANWCGLKWGIAGSNWANCRQP